jgi:hypothetical protein
MIVIKPAGQPAPKVEKRAAESVAYLLDCRELLEPFEVIVKTEAIDIPTGVTIASVRSRKGTSVEVRLDNASLGTAQYLDYQITLKLTTINHNVKLAVFQLRVHR